MKNNEIMISVQFNFLMIQINIVKNSLESLIVSLSLLRMI